MSAFFILSRYIFLIHTLYTHTYLHILRKKKRQIPRKHEYKLINKFTSFEKSETIENKNYSSQVCGCVCVSRKKILYKRITLVSGERVCGIMHTRELTKNIYTYVHLYICSPETIKSINQNGQ